MLRPEVKALMDDILKHPRQWTAWLPVFQKGSKVSTKKGRATLAAMADFSIHYSVILQKNDISIEWVRDEIVIKLASLPDCIVMYTTAEVEYLYDIIAKLTKTDTSQPILDELGKRF